MSSISATVVPKEKHMNEVVCKGEFSDEESDNAIDEREITIED